MNISSPQVQNLRRLLVVGEAVLARRSMDLGFGIWECGTYACLLGHYGRSLGMTSLSYTDDRFLYEHFGFNFAGHNGEVTSRLFGGGFCDAIHGAASEPGDEAYEELERRLTFLRELIAEHAPKYTGIPASVRAIFDVPALELLTSNDRGEPR